jgi:signal transduction histidine kinase
LVRVTLKSKEMLRSQQRVRLFGQRYVSIFAGLGAVTVVLILLLLLNLPQIQALVPSADKMSRVRAEWTKFLILFSLLSLTAATAIVTVYSYFATREKLARVQTTARAILESLVGGVLTLDANGRVTIINRAATQILETRPGSPYPNLAELSRNHPALVMLIRGALDAHRYVQDHDSPLVNSRNEQVVLRTSISEQLDEAGRRVGIVVLVKDVTKLVAMENELRKRDRLSAASTLAAGVAHEIRNPLSALELNLRLLRDEVASPFPSDEDIEGYFGILVAETGRLGRITTNFLQLSRPEPLANNRFPAHEPVLRVVRLIDREAHEKKISFVLDLAGDDPIVLGDSTKLEQVCLNILINAMQSMPDGGVIRIASATSCSDGGRFVNLSFADQGIGIPSENLSRLFDPYFTTRADGTGLGLAIADRIVTDHGGRILVNSAVGAGTTITVCLPTVDTADTGTEQALGQ